VISSFNHRHQNGRPLRIVSSSIIEIPYSSSSGGIHLDLAQTIFFERVFDFVTTTRPRLPDETPSTTIAMLRKTVVQELSQQCSTLAIFGTDQGAGTAHDRLIGQSFGALRNAEQVFDKTEFPTTLSILPS